MVRERVHLFLAHGGFGVFFLHTQKHTKRGPPRKRAWLCVWAKGGGKGAFVWGAHTQKAGGQRRGQK